MIRFLIRGLSKVIRIVFFIFFRFRFKSLGYNSYISFPFRIDGFKNIQIGRNTIIKSRSWLYCVKHLNNRNPLIIIGDGCNLGYNNHITCIGLVHISDFVLTANNVFITDNLHSYDKIDIPIIKQEIKHKKDVFIGEGTWIGENACIFGVKIGKNCVVAANSVVINDVPDYTIVAGNPAKVIKSYDLITSKWEIVK